MVVSGFLTRKGRVDHWNKYHKKQRPGYGQRGPSVQRSVEERGSGSPPSKPGAPSEPGASSGQGAPLRVRGRSLSRPADTGSPGRVSASHHTGRNSRLPSNTGTVPSAIDPSSQATRSSGRPPKRLESKGKGPATSRSSQSSSSTSPPPPHSAGSGGPVSSASAKPRGPPLQRTGPPSASGSRTVPQPTFTHATAQSHSASADSSRSLTERSPLATAPRHPSPRGSPIRTRETSPRSKSTDGQTVGSIGSSSTHQITPSTRTPPHVPSSLTLPPFKRGWSTSSSSEGSRSRSRDKTGMSNRSASSSSQTAQRKAAKILSQLD